ncbi:hypothetical protein [Desertivirga arenae]|uniref:hypothetical protein n=1 Tax=Desertivirga arenae TaxID=2810309 RepID=UPI001A9767D8|nr:hypothetical protein [Pedobacter sp. SYSU D00823]
MKEEDIYSELSSIRNLMERSSRFISLSGLSGVLAGVYALTGAFIAYRLVYREGSGLRLRDFYVNEPLILWPLFAIALAVLILSICTGVWLTIRQAKRKGENFWNPVSKRLLSSLCIPLFTGGFLILALIARGEYDIIAPVSLIFYGLALVSGSHYTYSDVKFLGFLEIALGLLAALMPGFGLVFWVIGFGFLHILYGAIMHFKYDK